MKRVSPATDDVLLAVDRIYEAAMDPTKWSDALEAVKKPLVALSAGLRFERFDAASMHQVWVGLDPAFEKAYVEHYWKDDVWANEARRGEPGEYAFGSEVVAPELLRRNAFYNELCVPYAMDDLIGGVLERSSIGMVSFGMMKRAASGRFAEEDVQYLGRLFPHLRRALRMSMQLERVADDGRVAWELLDRWPIAVYMLDDAGRVVRTNAAGERLFDGGLSYQDGFLSSPHPTAARALRESVARVVSRVVPDERSPAVTQLPRTDGRPALSATAIPVGRKAAFENGRVAAVVTVTDPAVARSPTVERLVTQFGLTQAEARVALMVHRGLSPKEIATELGTAWNTVRYQLRQVYAKTETSGQAGLVRVLTMLGIA